MQALLARHPEQAATLRERLDNLSALGILQSGPRTQPMPERLGDFRLLRPIGRGGMGVVYLAEQVSLQRQVALKLVHPELLFFPGARERFRREVLAIARLQHPGIVPILLGGEAEGIPFYAMERVHGASLGELLVELTGTPPAELDGVALHAAMQRALTKKDDDTAIAEAAELAGPWERVVCQLLMQAAAALQHAHTQGVLHRDVKPSNLLLTTTGRLRLIDFGLATAAGEQRLTRSGTTFGSLPYMAPEQVRGLVAQIDARTDVYQLGVTMYELLTLTLPHGDGSTGTRERILAGHVRPPSQHGGALSPDAEAVCLMAMDADPARRYATAAAFAEDLQALLEHRDVRARRASLWLRSRRWAKRNPARAATAAVLAFVLVPAPLAFAVQQHQANVAIRSALADTDTQRATAEANLQHALDAVERMLTRTVQTRLAQIPRTARLRRELLQDAIGIFERLVATTAGQSQPVREDRARAQARLGELQLQLGRIDQAQPLLEAAIATLNPVWPTSPRSVQLRGDLAHAEEQLAILHGRRDRPELAEPLQASACAHLLALTTITPTAPLVEAAVTAKLVHAKLLARLQRSDEAEACLQQLDAMLAPTSTAHATALGPVTRARHWAAVADARGVTLARSGRSSEAAACFVQALHSLDSIADPSSDANVVNEARAGLLERLALIHHQRRDWAAAAPFLDRACGAYESLAASEPDYPHWRARLARLLGSRAANRMQLAEAEAGGADHDRAIQLLQTLVAAAPDDGEFHRTLALAHADRAGWRAQAGQIEQAATDFTTAATMFTTLQNARPDDPQTTANLAAILHNHAMLHANAHDLATAQPLMRRCLELAATATGPTAERNLIETLATAGDLALRANDDQQGTQWIEQAATRAEAHLAAAPDDAERLSLFAFIAINRGGMHLSLQQPERAIAVWEQALPTVRRAGAASPRGRLLLGTMLLRLCDMHDRDGQAAVARTYFADAIAAGITKQQVARTPPLLALFERPEFLDLLPKSPHDK